MLVSDLELLNCKTNGCKDTSLAILEIQYFDFNKMFEQCSYAFG